MWLIPLVLAFGALRYRVALQVWALVLFAAGLLFLSLPPAAWTPALGETPPPPPPMPLIAAAPPNAVRFAMVMLVGVVLVLAVARTRRLLADALEETRRRLLLTRYLPQEVAALVTGPGGEALRRGRRQQAVVMFVDVRDFTGRSEGLPPEDVGAFLTGLRSEILAAASAHRGIVDKFIGDGALVVFGVPDPAADDADRALACAREILERVAAWSTRDAGGRPPVRLGIGIHAGEVFVGAIGEGARRECTVIGDTVNVAARVEEATKAAGVSILVTGEVRARARTSAGFRPLAEATLRGRRGKVSLHAPAG